MATVDPAATATIEDVQDILDTALDENILAAFINAANAIITDRLTGRGLSAAVLTQIEIWLAAHLATSREQQAESEDLPDYRVKYQGKFDLGLNNSRYGQMVLLLDSSNSLASAGQKRAGMIVFSTPAKYSRRL